MAARPVAMVIVMCERSVSRTRAQGSRPDCCVGAFGSLLCTNVQSASALSKHDAFDSQ